MHVIDAVNLAAEKFERFVVSFSIILMALVAIANVIGRNLFQHSFSWAEEVTQFAIVWVTFIGTSYAARKGAHIRMTALFDALGPRGRKGLMLVISAGTAALMFYLAWYGGVYTMKLVETQRHTLGLQIPLYLVILWVPVGFVMTGLQYVATFIRNLREHEVYISPTLADGQETSESYEV
jgi:TRAP-type C4-dicarboxylate transport system permease small subunit